MLPTWTVIRMSSVTTQVLVAIVTIPISVSLRRDAMIFHLLCLRRYFRRGRKTSSLFASGGALCLLFNRPSFQTVAGLRCAGKVGGRIGVISAFAFSAPRVRFLRTASEVARLSCNFGLKN